VLAEPSTAVVAPPVVVAEAVAAEVAPDVAAVL